MSFKKKNQSISTLRFLQINLVVKVTKGHASLLYSIFAKTIKISIFILWSLELFSNVQEFGRKGILIIIQKLKE